MEYINALSFVKLLREKRSAVKLDNKKDEKNDSQKENQTPEQTLEQTDEQPAENPQKQMTEKPVEQTDNLDATQTLPVFEHDIICNGKVFYNKGDEITPDKILKLCFRKIEKPVEPEKEPEIIFKPKEKEKEKELVKITGEEITTRNINDFQDNILKMRRKAGGLDFDEKKAEEFSEFCLSFAHHLKLPETEAEGIKVAGYYLNAGCIEFTEEDSKRADYKKRLSKASSSIVEMMGMSKAVVEGIRNAGKKYSTDTPLDKNSMFPYSHYISILLSYQLLKNSGKNNLESLEILSKNGVKYFNIFVLHKFINYMRSVDEFKSEK